MPRFSSKSAPMSVSRMDHLQGIQDRPNPQKPR
jgi:hypothetical protein